MTKTNETGLRLIRPSEPVAVTEPSEINFALAPYGSRIWPLDLSDSPDEIEQLLRRVTLEAAESNRVRDHFLLSRERLLELIDEAGRTPQIPGGGELSTLDLSHNVPYPELYIVVRGIDYSRFDLFHVNLSPDGAGVDEVMQILSGGGVKLLQHLPDHGLVTLEINCPDEKSGWVVTYDGAYPHIEVLAGHEMGQKCLCR